METLNTNNEEQGEEYLSSRITTLEELKLIPSGTFIYEPDELQVMKYTFAGIHPIKPEYIMVVASYNTLSIECKCLDFETEFYLSLKEAQKRCIELAKGNVTALTNKFNL